MEIKVNDLILLEEALGYRSGFNNWQSVYIDLVSERNETFTFYAWILRNFDLTKLIGRKVTLEVRGTNFRTKTETNWSLGIVPQFGSAAFVHYLNKDHPWNSYHGSLDTYVRFVRQRKGPAFEDISLQLPGRFYSLD